MHEERIALIVVTALACVAGTLLAGAAFLPAEGENTQFPLDDSIVGTKAGEGALLIAAGFSLIVGSLLTLKTQQARWALIALGVTVVAGISLDVVNYHYVDPVIERQGTLWEMRGDGAVVAAIAAVSGALSTLVAAGLAAGLAPPERRESAGAA
jgi:hypothetical protein